jgi:ketosteroid isomerase-like protein
VDVEELLAREAIRDLVARYNHHGDGGRLEAVAELFTEDGVLEYQDGRNPAETFPGRASIRDFLEETAARFAREASQLGAQYVRHHLATHVVDLAGPDAATGVAYVLTLRATGLAEWGRYFDDYRRVDGQWRFGRRRVRRDGVAGP